MVRTRASLRWLVCCAAIAPVACASPIRQADEVVPLSMAPIADQAVVRNTLTPRSLLVPVEIPTLDGAFVVQVRSDDPAIVPSTTAPCTSSPCTVSVTPSPAATATVTVDVVVETGEQQLSTSFTVSMVPLWVRDATDAAAPAPESLRDVLQRAEAGAVVAFHETVLDGPVVVPLVDTLPVARTVTIEGPGRDVLTLEGDASFRLVDVAEGAHLTATGVSLSQGTADAGGAVRIRGGASLTAVALAFTDNDAVNGGAIYVDDPGTASISGCHFERNSAANAGAVMALTSGVVEIEDSAFEANEASYIGAVFLLPDGVQHRIVTSTFVGNRAASIATMASAPGKGGGVDVLQTTFSRNVATVDAVLLLDGVRARDVRVDHNESAGSTVMTVGAPSLLEQVDISDNVGAGRGAGVAAFADHTEIIGSAIRGNTLTGDGSLGGGLYVGAPVSVASTEISANHGSDGGGIYVAQQGSVVVSDVAVVGNTAESGGGIHVGDQGSITLQDGTKVLENRAVTGAGALVHLGGELHAGDAAIGEPGRGNEALNGGGVFSIGTVRLDADTRVEGNAASVGGGIMHALPANAVPELHLGDATIRGNHADAFGGGIWWVVGSVLTAGSGVTISENSVGEPARGGGLWINGSPSGAFACDFPVDRVTANTDSRGVEDNIAPDPGSCGG